MSEQEQEKQLPAKEVRVAGSPTRCPFCMDLITDSLALVACLPCGARQHQQCYAEHGACSSCGGTEILVPQAKGTPSSDRPPAGSLIKVERGERTGNVTYSWAGLPGAVIAVWMILAVTLILTAPLVLWLWARYQKKPRSSLTLAEDRIRIEVAGLTKNKVYDRARKDVGAVKLERIGQGGVLRLSVDMGVERVSISTVGGEQAALKEPEAEWLYEKLLEWKAKG